MFLEAGTLEALALVGAVGAVAGVIGGFIASADSLIGTALMGFIGAIALSAIFRIAGAPVVYGVGDDFSYVWGALGGIVLGYVVGRSNV